MLKECLNIKNNEAYFENVLIKELVNKYGTPLFLISENKIRQNLKTYTENLKLYYENSLVLYASKALSFIKLLKIIKSENSGVDVVSEAELYTAKKAEINKDNIYFHGNNKTENELKKALEYGTNIVVDNIDELEKILKISKNTKVKIMFRVKFGIEAHTHRYIKTGAIDSKFGMTKEETLESIKKIKNIDNIEFLGIHSHIGSQIFDQEPFIDLAKIMIDFLLQIKKECEINVKEINIGGGIGVKYTYEDEPNIELFIKNITSEIKIQCKKYNLNLPKLIVEPGRSIVANAGITVYTVGNIKKIPNIKNYLSIDGGMTDNPRYMIYGSKYRFINISNSTAPNIYYKIVGKCCEQGDVIGDEIFLPETKPGDYLAVLTTGAYNYSMSSNYNKICRPAIVIVNDNNVILAVKRETPEDLTRNEIE